MRLQAVVFPNVVVEKKEEGKKGGKGRRMRGRGASLASVLWPRGGRKKCKDTGRAEAACASPFFASFSLRGKKEEKEGE